MARDKSCSGCDELAWSMNRKVKKGSVDWTIGKLIAVVLVIVLLVIVVFGWSNAIVPLYERAEGKINEVLILLNVRDGGGDFVECIEKDDVEIEGVGVGDVRICRDVCELELDVDIKGYSGRFKYKDERFFLEKGDREVVFIPLHKYFLLGDNTDLSFSYFSLDVLEYLKGVPVSTSERISVSEKEFLPKVKLLRVPKTLYFLGDYYFLDTLYWTDYSGSWLSRSGSQKKGELFKSSDKEFFDFLRETGAKRDILWKLTHGEEFSIRRNFNNFLFEDDKYKGDKSIEEWFADIKGAEVGGIELTKVDVDEYVNVLNDYFKNNRLVIEGVDYPVKAKSTTYSSITNSFRITFYVSYRGDEYVYYGSPLIVDDCKEKGVNVFRISTSASVNKFIYCSDRQDYDDMRKLFLIRKYLKDCL